MMEKSVSEDERAWFISPYGEMRARNRDRVSFPSLGTGGKRNMVSHHFTELVLEIAEIEMLPTMI